MSNLAADVDDVDQMDNKIRAFVLCSAINEIPPMCVCGLSFWDWRGVLRAYSDEMKGWLEGDEMTGSERAIGKMRKLSEIRGGILPPIVWKALRWCVTMSALLEYWYADLAQDHHVECEFRDLLCGGLQLLIAHRLPIYARSTWVHPLRLTKLFDFDALTGPARAHRWRLGRLPPVLAVSSTSRIGLS